MTSSRATAVRRIVAESVIGIAACAGIYLFAVDPAERRLTQVREQVRTVRDQSLKRAQDREATPEEAREQLAQARTFAEIVAHCYRFARNEAEMIETIAQFGTRHGVRIDDVRPATPRTGLKVKADGKASPGDRLVAYAFSMTAEYPRILTLLEDVQRELGFAIVQSVKLTPGDGPGQPVRVTVQTEHRSFDTSALTVAGAAGSQGGDQ